MAIEILLRNPRIVHQTADDECGIPEPPIVICNDSTPVIVLSQEGRGIIVNLATVPELYKAITELLSMLKIEQNADPIEDVPIPGV